MTTVFIAGSLSIKRLDPQFVERLANIVAKGLGVVVGDAKGADTSIQEALMLKDATKVVVYCTGETPRYNVGNWPVKPVVSNSKTGTRAFFTAKDIAMAKDADYGLMMWDSKSTGTLNNVLELLMREKKCVVFVNKLKEFMTISNVDHFKSLVNVMSDNAAHKAELKINLSRRISGLENHQLAFPV